MTKPTIDDLQRLRVDHVVDERPSRYSWFKFYNKPLSLALGEKIATTELICWLDSDILIVSEPSLFSLSECEDFAACASDKEMGTSGPSDPFEAVWRANCGALGLDIDDLPWVTTERDKCKIRLYWNGGVFVYRRVTGFGAHYRDVCERLMEARNKMNFVDYSIGINEMSAIGIAMHLQKLRYRALPQSHNYSIGSKTYPNFYREADLRSACVVHYHDAMWPWFWSTFIECLRDTHRGVAEWLSPLGPMKNPATTSSRVIGRLYRFFRSEQEKRYLKLCSSV
ncbi:MAG: hypothetical protein P4M07_13410 [Xanthobacteraceae bacterium]|nr:hypothetical protein [Xanthobacteraceae bacterium]